MNKLFFLVCAGLAAACGGGGSDKPDITVIDAAVQCIPAMPDGMQGCPTGQKCTWNVDLVNTTAYVGHIACVPNGTKQVGEACTYGQPGNTGYDDCVAGAVCTAFRNPAVNAMGVCKLICDRGSTTGQQCDQDHVCVNYNGLFVDGTTTKAGVCNQSCNPLTDNDYDGSGTLFTRTGTTCQAEDEGCYGGPSLGKQPPTGFSCTKEYHYDAPNGGYRHRTECTETNGCADPGTKIFTNSCNQGYVPVLIEATGSSVTICVAYCEPVNCFMGNCGSNNVDRLGKAPNRCSPEDRIGTFDGVTMGSDDGEHCRFLWASEIDRDTKIFLPSQWSDKIGFCVDHSKYQYDADGDGTPDTMYPACATLPDGFGMPGALGAAVFGCVDSTRMMMSNGKVSIPDSAWDALNKVDMPRPLYDQSAYESLQ